MNEEASAAEQRNALINNKIRQIIIVDKAGKIKNVVTLDDIIENKSKTNRVILMAGGLGVRLGTLTKEMPKPMLHVGGKPILQRIIESFTEEGFSDFYISLNYKGEIIKDYFADGAKFNCSIKYIEEPKKLGTAGAISLFKEETDEPIIIMNGDVLTGVKFGHLLDFYKSSEAAATMAIREYSFEVPFGVVKIKDDQITEISEKPVHNFFVNAGIYVLDPKVIQYIPKGVFYDMPTFFQDLRKMNKKTTAFPIREYWLDIGKKEQLEQANKDYSQVFGYEESA